MARALSAGIVLYRRRGATLEVLLAHPGGPFWSRRDAGAWTIPKGLVAPGEEPLAAARREFIEETGIDPGAGGVALTPRRQPSGKVVHAWAIEGDCEPRELRSNEFEMEWPPKSGRMARFPEIDRAEWFALEAARGKILKGQAPFIEELAAMLDRSTAP